MPQRPAALTALAAVAALAFLVMASSATGCASPAPAPASADAQGLAAPQPSPTPTASLSCEQLTLPLHDVSLSAQDNANTTFDAVVHTPPVAADVPLVLTRLRVGTQEFPIRGWDPTADPVPLYFRLPADAARALARAAPSTWSERGHPGHTLAGAFEPSAPSFERAQDVRIDFTLRNTGPVPVHWNDGGRWEASSGRNGRFSFRFERDGTPLEDPIDPVSFGGLGARRSLEPGEAYSLGIDLEPWCAFDTPGVYRVEARYALEFHDPTFQRVLWDDAVRGSFEIELR